MLTDYEMKLIEAYRNDMVMYAKRSMDNGYTRKQQKYWEKQHDMAMRQIERIQDGRFRRMGGGSK